MEEKLVKPKHKHYKYLTNKNTNSFFISPTNSGEVLTIIKELSNDKSTRPATIHKKFLKLFQIVLSKSISLIANLSFSSGRFPNNLKVTNVIPTFRKTTAPFTITATQFHYFSI